MKKFQNFIKNDNNYSPVETVEVYAKLPPGMYSIDADPMGNIFFTAIQSKHDSLIDLPGTEFDTIVSEIDTFMDAKTAKLFDKYGFVYKRSTLMYGRPGTGKTSIVNRVIQKVIEDNGIVFFSPNPKFLEPSFHILNSIQPETRVMVVFEELDRQIERYETELLNLLDGEIQRSNIIYLATTNYIERIPARIRRPGRFATCIEVGFPKAETRRFYLETKIKGHKDIEKWVSLTEGFSIDELKETVLSVMCLGAKLEDIVKRVKENKEDSGNIDPDFEEDDDSDEIEYRASYASRKFRGK